MPSRNAILKDKLKYFSEWVEGWPDKLPQGPLPPDRKSDVSDVRKDQPPRKTI